MAATNDAFELVLIELDGSTTALPLPNGQAFIGSSGKCGILIPDASVAPVHAEVLTSTDGGLWIRDIAKRNDTLVNGQPIETSKLEDGAFIKVGQVDLCVRAKGRDSGQHGTMIRQSASAVPALSPPRPRAGAVPKPAASPKPKPSPTRIQRSKLLEPVDDLPTDGMGVNVNAAARPRPSPTAVRVRTNPDPNMEPTSEPNPFEEHDATYARSEALSPGVIIDGRYKILSKIAEGGMGEVYKALHISLEKEVALKVMKQQLGDDAGFAERFKREAVAAGRIGQQNICNVSDFATTENGRFYFVMEYLEGETLGQLIRDRGAMPISRAIFVMTQLCHALAAAHKAGIVHRDLKPENVMLLQRPGQQDFVKVLDFGVAKVKVAGESGGTQVGMVVGTPQYMAPEQASGLTTDARTDVYALGLIFYEMLQGTPTFNDDTPGLLMAAQIYRTPQPLTFTSGDPMPGCLQELVSAMLAKPPEQRPQTMEEVLAGLQHCTEKLMEPIAKLATPAMSPPLRPSQVRPVAVTLDRPPTGPAPAVTELDAVEIAAVTGKRGGSAGRWVAIGAVLVVLVGGGLGVAVRSLQQPDPAQPVPPVAEVEKPPLPKIPDPPVAVVKPTADTATVKLSLVTLPPGAEVAKNGAVIGVTPLELDWPKGARANFTLQLDGYAKESRDLAPEAGIKLEIKLRKLAGAATSRRPVPAGTKPDPGALLDDPYGEKVKDLHDSPYEQ